MHCNFLFVNMKRSTTPYKQHTWKCTGNKQFAKDNMREAQHNSYASSNRHASKGNSTQLSQTEPAANKGQKRSIALKGLALTSITKQASHIQSSLANRASLQQYVTHNKLAFQFSKMCTVRQEQFSCATIKQQRTGSIAYLVTQSLGYICRRHSLKPSLILWSYLTCSFRELKFRQCSHCWGCPCTMAQNDVT